MTGGEFVIQYLVQQGIKVIFGVPGNQLTELYEGIYKCKEKIIHINCRHEGGASLMAEGYAKSTGEVCVCLVSPGPGASNAYVGITEAFTSCSPLLIITVYQDDCHSEKDQERFFHGLDHVKAYEPITRWASKVKNVEDLPNAMKKAFEKLINGRPGPVLLEFKMDVLEAEVDCAIPGKFHFVKQFPNEGDMIEAANIINKSKKPFIIAGREVFALGAENELLKLAKYISAPVITTCMGKGVVSEYEELSLGSILNLNYYKKMDVITKEADLCIAIGTRFTQIDTDSWSLNIPIPLISMTIDDTFLNKEYTSDYSLVGDIKLNLELLMNKLNNKVMDGKWANIVLEVKKDINSVNYPEIIRNIREELDDEGILVNDVHIEGFSTCGHFKVSRSSNYIQSSLSLGVGYALPAAIGAKIAFPYKQVIAFSGDGGFLMSSPDFATAMKYGINVVFVVVNDNTYGTIKRRQPSHLHETIGLSLYNPDFMAFANAYNSKAYKVTNIGDFKAVLKMALEMNEPSIIEVVKNEDFYNLL